MPFRIQTYACQSIVFFLLTILLVVGWIGVQSIRQSMEESDSAQKRLTAVFQVKSLIGEVYMRTQLFKEERGTRESVEAAIFKVSRAVDGLLYNAPSKEQVDRAGRLKAYFQGVEKAASKQSLLQSVESKQALKLSGLIDNMVSFEQAFILKTGAQTRASVYFYASLVAILAVLMMAFHSISGYLHRTLTKTLEKLVRGTEKISKFNYEVDIPETALSSEMSNLLDRFRKLTSIYKKRYKEQNELEKRYNVQTNELSAANDKLIRLNDMRVQFLTDISHELKTPLTTIKGETEIRLRREGQTESEYRSTLSHVKVLCDDMSTLVDDLLFLARSEKDAISFDFRRNDLEGVITSAVANYELMAKEKEICIDIDWSDQPLEISMDVFRLKQAFNIVLDNALKYSFMKTDINIIVRDTGENAQLVFENKGEQIPEEDLPYVFERFYRVQKYKQNGSSGLGLSIAKWIINKHDGEITLTSSPDGVTRVVITLPRFEPLKVVEMRAMEAHI